MRTINYKATNQSARRISLLLTLLLASLFSLSAATITVMNTNDAGAGSLRQAISNAANGDEIVFDAAIQGQTITLTSGSLGVLEPNLTINGGGDPCNGIQGMIIDGNANDLVFFINQPNVTLKGLTIQNGKEPFNASGIFVNDENCTISDCLIIGNDAGGILVNDENCTISNCLISGNKSDGNGGGIKINDDNCTISNCLISGNKSNDEGGGIYINGTNAKISDCTISGNTTTQKGGGIYLTAYDLLILENTLIAKNYAPNGNDINSLQGPTQVTDNGNNHVMDPAGGHGITDGNNVDPLFIDCNITAPSTGGNFGLTCLSPALANGAGYPCLNPVSNEVTNTNDSGAGSLRDAIANANDGECICFDPAIQGQQITLTSGSLLIQKSITIKGGGDPCNGVQGMIIDGNANGSVFRVTADGAILEGMTIQNGTGFNISNIFVNKFGGGIFLRAKNVEILKCTIINNIADSGGGIATSIFTNIDSGLKIVECIISGNTANDNGGGMYSTSPFTMDNSIVSGNYASLRGGGIRTRHSNTTVYIKSSTISKNHADGAVGGIAFDNGIAPGDISNSVIALNTVPNTIYGKDINANPGNVTDSGNNHVYDPLGNHGITDGNNVDPLFIDCDITAPSTGGNFGFQCGSPLLGTTTGYPCAVEDPTIDNLAPTALCQDITVSLDASGNATITAAQIDNGSTDACDQSLTLSIDNSSFSCADLGANTVTLTVSDDAGNSATCTTTVTVTETPDGDGDGVTLICGGDCDDTDPLNFPGNTEVCDGQDNNCDGFVDEGFDADGDGFTSCGGDCDDNNAAINPNAVEICFNGIDENCDGIVDGCVYCPSSGSNNTTAWIHEMKFNAFVNSSGNDNGYGDYTSTIIESQQGSNSIYLKVLKSTFSLATNHWSVWIDLNFDGDFYDPGERVLNTVSALPINTTINIPNTSLLGLTRMRITYSENSFPSPCANIGNGEVEDYMIDINPNGSTTTPTTNCSGFTSGGTIDANEVLCPGENDPALIKNVTFPSGGTFAIIEYQWMKSTVTAQLPTGSNNNGWTFIPNTNGANYDPPAINQTTYYARAARKRNCPNFEHFSNVVEKTFAPVCVTNYCSANGVISSQEWIDKVSCGTINNTSGNNGGYADFTNQTNFVHFGQLIGITLWPKFSGFPNFEKWGVWIDWNQDGDFLDAGEKVVSASSSNIVSSLITVPFNAQMGDTRMRVVMQRGYSNPQPCGTFQYGEVEDYTIHVIGFGNAVAQEEDAELQQEQTVHSNEMDLLDNENLITPMAQKESKLSLYPNPTNGILNIKLDSDNDNSIDIILFNQMGQIMFQQKTLDKNYKLDLSSDKFASGVYTVVLRQGNIVKKERLVITK